MKQVAIIGFGQFGRLAAATLSGRYATGVHDPFVTAQDIVDAGHVPMSLEQAAAADVVVVAVPVQGMEQTIQAIAPHIRPGATVVDVASVKMLPSEWLQRYIPDHAHIVPTHPLFGPQSAALGLAGRQLVLCPVRGDQHIKIAALGDALGLRVRITTPEEHDREMAYVQALTHLIGRSLVEMDIPDERMKTQSYQHLIDLTGLIGNDSFELFTAIQTFNPYARDVVRDFVARDEGLLQAVNPWH